MASTKTLADPAAPWDERYLIKQVETRSGDHEKASPSQSNFFSRLLGRAELVMLPMSIAASFAAPGIGTEYYRTVVRSKASRPLAEIPEWGSDLWIYTEEMAVVEEIRALNALLALPAPEGMWIELDDE